MCAAEEQEEAESSLPCDTEICLTVVSEPPEKQATAGIYISLPTTEEGVGRGLGDGGEHSKTEGTV